jgi:hypothetical protein
MHLTFEYFNENKVWPRKGQEKANQGCLLSVCPSKIMTSETSLLLEIKLLWSLYFSTGDKR